MKAPALVTGATGFLGRHLIAVLKESAAPVTIWQRRAIPGEIGPGVRVEPWPDPEDMAAAIAALDHPVIFHLAAAGVMNRAERDPATQFEANVHLTWLLATAAVRGGARGLVYAGSCSEYGTVTDAVPVHESAPLAATDSYGASKAAGGMLARSVTKDGGIGFAWARLFGIYGPGEPPSRLIPALHASLSGGRPIDLTPGDQQRDWLFVRDAALGLARLGAYVEGGGHAVFNLCTGVPHSTREVVLGVARRLGADERLLRFGALPARPEEAPWLVGNPGVAGALGWAAETNLDAGIDASIRALRMPPRAAEH